MSPALTLFGHGPVPAYEWMVALGACVLVTVVAERVTRDDLSRRRAFVWLAGTYVAAIAGARVAFAATWLPSGRDAAAALTSPHAVGFSSLGGAMLGATAAWWLARRLGLPFERLVGPLVLGGCAFGALARVGCFLAGCCHGAPTALPWGVSYPDGTVAARALGPGVAVHPSPLYEATLLLAIAAGLAWHGRQQVRGRAAACPDLAAVALASAAYLFGRFWLEFLRAQAERYQGLAAAQWMALLLLILGAAWAARFAGHGAIARAGVYVRGKTVA